eukprot:gb/GECH01006718.1/.p1 GENE.gb/GECH01006718.1/~~gb/GECH01006718.1/.p1  ORF type:complete len:1050 (+),score=141.04 gb/GECH01006718.1/:1-3150(+)
MLPLKRKYSFNSPQLDLGEPPTKKPKHTHNLYTLSNSSLDTSTSTQHSQHKFPREVLFVIFKFLGQRELVRGIGYVCRRWRRVSRCGLLWRGLGFPHFPRVNSIEVLTRFLSTVFDGPAPLAHLTFPDSFRSVSEHALKQLRSISPLLSSFTIPSSLPLGDNALRTLAKFPQLQTLDLSNHTQLTDDTIFQIVKEAPFLKCLILDSCLQLTNASLQQIFIHCKYLQGLSIQGCPDCILSNDNIHYLSRRKYQFPALQELSVEFEDMDTQSVNEFSQLFPNMNKLHIHGWRSPSPTKPLSLLVSILPSLSSLTILLSKQIELFSFNLTNPNLEEIRIANCKEVSYLNLQCPRLKSLKMECIDHIQQLELEQNYRMERLSFRSCKFNQQPDFLSQLPINLSSLEIIDATGINKLAIPSCHKLKTLSLVSLRDLEQFSVVGSQVESVAVEMCMKLKKASIDCAKMQRIKWFTMPHRELPKVTHLYLRSKKLEILNLERCINLETANIIAPSLTALNMSRCKKLEQFNMNCPSLGKLALAAPYMQLDLEFADMVTKHCPNLNMLSITDTSYLTDEILEYIVSGLKYIEALVISRCANLKSPRLSSKTVSGVQLTECSEISQFQSNFPSLTKVIFKQCSKLQDSTFDYLSQNSPKLKAIEIENCPRILYPTINQTQLSSMHFTRCINLKQINISSNSIQKFIMIQCPKLSNISIGGRGLPVREMILQSCFEITDNLLLQLCDKIPLIQALVLADCRSLNNPSISSSSLRLLQFANCPRLKTPQIQAPKLETCSFKNCPMITASTTSDLLQTNTSPRNFELVGCSKIDTFRFDSQNTENINIVNCPQLTSLDSLDDKLTLKKVSVVSCSKLDSIQLLGKVEELLFKQCFELSNLSLGQVRAITVSDSDIADKWITVLLNSAPNLNTIRLEACSVKRPFIEHTSLESVTITKCQSMETLFMECPSLRSFELNNCENISVDFVFKLNASSTLGNLKKLVLNRLRCLTTTAVDKILSRCTSLSSLNLSNTGVSAGKLKHYQSRFSQRSIGVVNKTGGS